MVWAPFKALVFLSLLLTACVTPSQPENIMQTDDAAIFETFKTLEGVFHEVDTDGTPARIEYRLIARGTALTETWYMPAGQYGPDGKEELTVFHMNNGKLVATHYCGVGIQSTMHLKTDPQTGEHKFLLHSISNLPSPEASHNSGFGYRFDGEDSIQRSEEWMIDGEPSISHLTMVRAE